MEDPWNYIRVTTTGRYDMYQRMPMLGYVVTIANHNCHVIEQGCCQACGSSDLQCANNTFNVISHPDIVYIDKFNEDQILQHLPQ